MAVRKLASIYERFFWRTDRILTAFRTPLPANAAAAEQCRPIHTAGEAYLVNRLQMLWGEYCRNLIILSARGNALTVAGKLISPAPGLAGFPQIKAVLGNSFGGGPSTRWDDRDWAIGRANILKPVNGNQINIGLGTAPIKDLKVVRNFLIHPNQRTRSAYLSLARYLGYPGLEPKSLLAADGGNGMDVIGSWVKQFQDSAWEAAR